MDGSATSPTSQIESITSAFNRRSSSRFSKHNSDTKTTKKLGHRRVNEQGFVTYKKKPTSELQCAIQLGINHSIGSVQQKPDRDVLLCDFQVVQIVDFPKSGSKTTPAHSLSDFRFRTFAPVAFRAFRSIFELDISDFLNSLCNQELRELSNPGASGSIFYISQDDEFIVKTVQLKEADFLQKLLPEYYMNLIQHPRTLLPKFYGLYCYQCGGKNIRFVIMNNLLPSSINLHQKYDLKGSSYKRKASSAELSKESPTLKDLDFKVNHPTGIGLEGETFDALIKTIERDCRVLESFRIMDYSLLLGVHNLDKAKRERLSTQGSKAKPDGSKDVYQAENSSSSSQLEASGDYITPDESKNGVVFVALRKSSPPGFPRNTSHTKSQKRLTVFSTAMESIQATTQPVELETEERELIPPGGIPARNAAGDRLLLFIGIIDILQSYRLAKKLEHSFKAAVIDGKTVSVTHPAFYANRFQNTLKKSVFRKISSLDQPQLMGSNAVPFRRIMNLCMKNATPRHKSSFTLKPPLPESVFSGHTTSLSANKNDIYNTDTTWPRNGPLKHNRTPSSQTDYMAGLYSKSPMTMSKLYSYYSNLSELNRSPSPAPQGAYSKTQKLYMRPPSSLDNLSWCAQSIMSLGLASDAASLRDLTESSSYSETEANLSVELKSDSRLEESPVEPQVDDLSRQISDNSDHLRETIELECELKALQKLSKKLALHSQKKAIHLSNQQLSISPANLGVTSEHFKSLSNIPDIISTASSSLQNNPPQAPKVTDKRSRIRKSSLTASDAVYTFMQDAALDFGISSIQTLSTGELSLKPERNAEAPVHVDDSLFDYKSEL